MKGKAVSTESRIWTKRTVYVIMELKFREGAISMEQREIDRLARAAVLARKNSYAPYSGFAVGAALLCRDWKLFTGCNVESASYGVTVCAERVALCKAVSGGERQFAALAVAGGKAGLPPAEYCPPCGVCRQAFAEFCTGDFPVILAKDGAEPKLSTLAELLPMRFGPEQLAD